jgi:hypothetical protein
MHTDPLQFAYHYAHSARERAESHRIAAEARAARAARDAVDATSRTPRRRRLPVMLRRTASA